MAGYDLSRLDGPCKIPLAAGVKHPRLRRTFGPASTSKTCFLSTIPCRAQSARGKSTVQSACLKPWFL